MDEGSVQRLLHGNWEYDSDLSKLFAFQDLTDLFTNDFIDGDRFNIVADIARFGSDKTVIGLWKGWRLEKIISLSKSSIVESAEAIRKLANEHHITMSNVVVDEDGVGGGVKDILRCKGFVNNSKALKVEGEVENYSNLKSQCYYKLADKVRKGEVFIKDTTLRDTIIEELEQIRQRNMDKDEKKAVVGKDKIKEMIGRSPDYADMIMMRVYFDIVQTSSWVDDLY
jgi:hypothetical protein